MPPDGWPFWAWAASLAPLAAYLALFALAGRPVSLRPPRLALLVALPAAARLALWPAWPAATLGLVGVGAVLAGACLLLLARRTWLVRTAGEELRRELDEACRRLFIACTEPRPGLWRLVVKGREHSLGAGRLGARLLVLHLPGAGGPGKLALLLGWLAKHYPGPVPTVKVALKRRESCPPTSSR